MSNWERRTFNGDVHLEIRDDGKHPTVVGYAAVFNSRSQDLGGFVEQIDRRAFNRTVQQADVRALVNHDPNLLIGRNTAGTLSLEVDKTGLRYEVQLPSTTVGNDTREMISRGDMDGSSFGFRTIDDDWEEDEDGRMLRTLKEVALRDVGPVTFPAYTSASSALRSLAEARSLDLNDLVAAADCGELREYLHTTDTAPATTVVLPPAGEPASEAPRIRRWRR